MSIGRNHVSLNQGAHKIPGAVEALNKLRSRSAHGAEGDPRTGLPEPIETRGPWPHPSDDDARESDREIVL